MIDLMQRGENSKEAVIVPEPIAIDLSPYAMAIFSCDINAAAKSIDASKRFSAAKYFLICLSMELAIKSILLNLNVPKGQLKSAGHDLGKLLDKLVEYAGPQLVTAREDRIIRRIVRFYDREPGSGKGLVYFEENMKSQALRRYRDIPDIKELGKIQDKLQNHLRENDYYL